MPLFARLQYLAVGYNGMTVHGARALAGAPALANLRRMWLGVDPLGDDGVRAVVHSPYLHPRACLVLFWLSETEPRAACAEAVSRLGSRVATAGQAPPWMNERLIDWPLWQPEA